MRITIHIFFATLLMPAFLCGMDPTKPSRSKRPRNSDDTPAIFTAISDNNLLRLHTAASKLTPEELSTLKHDGQTLLTQATRHDFILLVNALIKVYHVDASATDAQGNTALHIAAINNSLKSTKSLLEYNKNLLTKSNTEKLIPLKLAALHTSRDVFKLLLKKTKPVPRSLYCWASQQAEGIQSPFLKTITSTLPIVLEENEDNEAKEQEQLKMFAAISQRYYKKLTGIQKCCICPCSGIKHAMTIKNCCANFFHQSCLERWSVTCAKNIQTPTCPCCRKQSIPPVKYNRLITLPNNVFNWMNAHIDELHNVLIAGEQPEITYNPNPWTTNNHWDEAPDSQENSDQENNSDDDEE